MKKTEAQFLFIPNRRRNGFANKFPICSLIPDMIMKLFITKKGKREGMIVKAQSLIAFNIPSDTTLPNISVTGIKAKKMIAKI